LKDGKVPLPLAVIDGKTALEAARARYLVHPASGWTPANYRKGLWLLTFEIRAAVV
jgi:hypothetical protein